MTRRNSITFGLVLFSAVAFFPPGALAQGQYPVKPIRLIVPFAPGGLVDLIGRLWAEKVGASVGTIVVDNRGGAGGALGTAEAARAQPDGYTLLLGNTSTQVLNPSVMSRPTYNPDRDFVAIDIIAISATSIVVHPSLPARNIKELVSYARKNQGKLSYGSAGAGTLTHLAGELFKQRAGGLDILHVPYKGAGPGITDLIGGYIPMMTPNVTSQVLNLHEAGRLRILAVNAPARLKGAPNIPAAVETLPDMIAQVFSGVFAPAGTPKPIIDRISQATRKVLADEGFQKTLIQSGFEPVLDSSPEKAQRFINEEQKRLIPVIKATGFKLD